MQGFSRIGKYKIWILAAVIAALAIYWYLQRPAPSPSYQTARVERGTLTATVIADGSIRARQSAVLAWQVSGIVEKVQVKIGDAVRKDEVLATLKRDSLPQNVLLAESDLASAQRELENLLHSNTQAVQAWIALRDAQDAYDKAKRYYDALFKPYTYEILTWRKVTFTIPFPTPTTITRTVPMFKTVHLQEADEETKADAKADLDLKAAQLEDARRNYERLKDGPDAVLLSSLQARIAAAQATLNLARLSAPFDGIVTQVLIQPNDLVTPGTLAFRIDDLSTLYLEVNVSEIDINQIKEGQTATITLDGAPGKSYRGTVVEIGRVGESDGQTIQFKVRLSLDDPDENVRPGMSATARITLETFENVLLVPNRAIRLIEGKYTVYVLRQGEAQPVQVELGPSGETMTLLLSNTIQEGDLLVLNPPLDNRNQNGPPPFVRGR
uniref:Hypothetical conserved protein n=1 Tax=uncultured Chloroflexota bacterium TaxID=166587 RepID=H5SDY5_9CHLR|nr:hypothetical conserved protein [uncultured Chloroflexota bacterium]